MDKYKKRVLIPEIFTKFSRQIDVNLQEIKINKSYNGLNGLTIAQISDLHIHKWNMKLIEDSIDLVNSLNPDIIVVTGDVICNGKKFIPDLIRLFNKLTAKYGKFACLGNHDHSDGDDSHRIQHFFKKVGFQILVNDSSRVYINGERLHIAGADDIELGEQNILKMVKNISDTEMSIFLTHNPVNFKQFTKYNPDLVLAGHTHGAQFSDKLASFIYKYFLGTEYVAGLYKHKNSTLYVNKGIGTALVSPVIFNRKLLINTPRLFSKPEISLFNLITSS